MTVRILASGDQAMTVELSDRIDEAVSRQVASLAQSLASDPIAGVGETVPTYRSLLVTYDPQLVRGAVLERMLLARFETLDTAQVPSRLWTIPVLYGGPCALDIEAMAAMKGMTVDALVALHCEADYRVYMIGFAPGFAYLGGLPERLHTPRLATPRQRIEAGSIGIGGKQASVNSVAGPSGWRFIGRTPVRLFDPNREAPFLLQAGDRVRFAAVDADQAARLDRAAAAGETVVEPVTA